MFVSMMTTIFKHFNTYLRRNLHFSDQNLCCQQTTSDYFMTAARRTTLGSADPVATPAVSTVHQ
jgi:hypothetical protein